MTGAEAKDYKAKHTLDPLALASDTPDLPALQAEFELAMEWGPSQQKTFGLAFGTRLNAWEGQTTDGLKWQRFQPPSVTVRPYDGRPDTRQPLTDSIINSLVDIDMAALYGAQIKPSPTHVNKLTAQQSAEMRAGVRWMLEGPLMGDLIDGAEYLSQMKNTLGWCVIHPYWKSRNGLCKKTLTMEQFQEMAAQAPEDSILRKLPEMILAGGTLPHPGPLPQGEGESSPEQQQDDDESDITGKSAAELLQTAYPYLKRKTAERIIKELRENQETEFVYQEQNENRPALEVLVPGVDVFLPEEVQDQRDARAWFKRRYWNEADVRAMAGRWNEKFIEAVIQTAGQVSFGDLDIKEQTRDKNARRIEIITSFVRQTDEDGCQAIYCTVFSNFVPDLYAEHYMLDYAHGQYPFELARTEIIGPRPDSSRGVPAVLRTQQWELKRQRDNLHILSELRTNPPRLRIGLGWSKAEESYAPGSNVTNTVQGSDLKYLTPPADSGQLTMEICESIRMEAEDYYALPRAKTEAHPTRWQARQMRVSKRWLLTWARVYWQLLVLMYSTYDEEELTGIIGHPPLLDVETLKKQQVNLKFDSRALDPDWVKMVLEAVGKIRAWNTGGTIDDNKLVQVGLAYMDPTLADEITSDQAGAANAVYKDVEHHLMSIAQGNPPQLAENDPTAGMKLKMAQGIISKNPRYQMSFLPKLANGQENPHFEPDKAQHLETLMKNWQHNVQETQTSKVQGRLGVAEVNDAPVEHGAPVARK